MKKILSKLEAKKQIDEFFENIEGKNEKDVKKIKRLAMSYNIPLKDKKKLFCKKCFNPYKTPKIRIRNKIKSVGCENCGETNRLKL